MSMDTPPKTLPRPVEISGVLLAGFTLFLSTVGQAYVLLSSSTLASRYPYVSSTDMIAIFVAFLSTVGGSWLFTLSKRPQAIRLDVEREPLLDPFGNEKPLKIQLLPERLQAHQRCAQAVYLPYFIAGNVCLGIWILLGLAGYHITSQIVLLVNLMVQNYAVFIALHAWKQPQLQMSKDTWVIHVLSKGNAAIAILFLWKNSGMLESLASPTIAEMLNNGSIFVLMAVGGGPDPVLGFFLLYDLCALAYGTGAVTEWQVAFQYTALMVLFVLAWDVSRAPTDRSSNPMEGIVEGGGEITLDSGYHRHY